MLITNLNNTGFKFGQKTWYTSKHLGQDKQANFIEYSFPVDLFDCKYTTGKEGGLTVEGKDILGYTHRFMHNSKFLTKAKEIKAETPFVVSGNTGSYTTGPHIHWDSRKPNKASLVFENFIDPLIWQKEILPKILSMNANQLPEWFKANKTQEIMEARKIVKDWSDPFRLVPQYVMAEYLRKVATVPKIKLNVFLHNLKLTKSELDAYRLARNEIVRFFLPFVEIQFQEPELLEQKLSVNIYNFKPRAGLNLIISTPEIIDNISVKGVVDGIMFDDKRTCFVKKHLLTRKDSRNRGLANGFTYTLIHELFHWFAILDPTGKDRTHDFDYDLTAANYLNELMWEILHDSEFRKANSLD